MSEKKNPRNDDRIPDDEPKSFLEHLEELRGAIIWTVGVFIACFAAACCFVPRIMTFLAGPLGGIKGIDPATFLISYDVSEPFMIWMKVGLWSGLIVALPIIVFIIGNFVIPGLTLKERRVLRIALGISALLFASGVWLCYNWTLPVALKVMYWIPEKINITVPGWTVGSYTIFVLRLLLAFGLAFELPVVVYALGSLGIISSKKMREKRRHVVVGLLVLAMVLTPQDPWTMLMMAVPLICLFEISVWLVKMHELRAKKKSVEEADADFEFDDYEDL